MCSNFNLFTHILVMIDSAVIAQEGDGGNRSIEEYSIIIAEEVDSTIRKMMTVFSPHFGIFIVERYQDDEDKEQMIENMIMKLQVMMDEARKRQQQDGNNNNSIVGIINVPEEVMMFHIVGYLNRKEVVSGLSETNKLYSTLIRDRYGIESKMYSDEVLNISPGVWKNISSVRLVPTIWAERGVRYEDFMNSLSKDMDGKFTSKEVKTQLDWHPECKIPFSV
jgi:c-di-GMP-related signal transduction protein